MEQELLYTGNTYLMKKWKDCFIGHLLQKKTFKNELKNKSQVLHFVLKLPMIKYEWKKQCKRRGCYLEHVLKIWIKRAVFMQVSLN
jgi:hypothetical protein